MRAAGSIRAAFAFLAALACTVPAVAQDDKAPGSDKPPSTILEQLKLKTDVGQMPDFVVKSRPPPDSLHYIPVGSPPPEPAAPVLSVDEIKAEESELDGLRDRHDRLAHRKSEPGSHLSVADGRKSPPVKPAKPKCILTCDILHIPKPGEH
jgi:hypothetical protein